MRHSITKKGQKFINKEAAMMALQSAQAYFALQGFLTIGRISIETKMMELTIHFEMNKYPTLPEWVTYSEKEISSHTSYLEVIKETRQVRCMYLYYRW